MEEAEKGMKNKKHSKKRKENILKRKNILKNLMLKIFMGRTSYLPEII